MAAWSTSRSLSSKWAKDVPAVASTSMEDRNSRIGQDTGSLKSGLPTPATQKSFTKPKQHREGRWSLVSKAFALSKRLTRTVRDILSAPPPHEDFPETLYLRTPGSTHASLGPKPEPSVQEEGKTHHGPDEKADTGNLDEVNEVVVDRIWNEPFEYKTLAEDEDDTGSYFMRSTAAGDRRRTRTAKQEEGIWGWMPLAVLRWRLWPAVCDFFEPTFDDPVSTTNSSFGAICLIPNYRRQKHIINGNSGPSLKVLRSGPPCSLSSTGFWQQCSSLLPLF